MLLLSSYFQTLMPMHGATSNRQGPTLKRSRNSRCQSYTNACFLRFETVAWESRMWGEIQQRALVCPDVHVLLQLVFKTSQSFSSRNPPSEAEAPSPEHSILTQFEGFKHHSGQEAHRGRGVSCIVCDAMHNIPLLARAKSDPTSRYEHDFLLFASYPSSDSLSFSPQPRTLPGQNKNLEALVAG